MKTAIEWHKTQDKLPKGCEPCWFTIVVQDDIFDDSTRHMELHHGEFDPSWQCFRDEYATDTIWTSRRSKWGVSEVPYWSEDIPLPPCPPPCDDE